MRISGLKKRDRELKLHLAHDGDDADRIRRKRVQGVNIIEFIALSLSIGVH